MDPVLSEIYSTVLPAAPYVIAAYALMMLAILGYVAYVLARLGRTEKRLAALEEHLGVDAGREGLEDAVNRGPRA